MKTKTKAKDGQTDGFPAGSEEEVVARTLPAEVTISGPGLRKLQFPSDALGTVDGVDGQVYVARVKEKRISLVRVASSTSPEVVDGKWRTLARIGMSGDRIGRIQLDGLGDEQARRHDRSIYIGKAGDGSLSLDAYKKSLPGEREDGATVRSRICEVVLREGEVRQIVIRDAADELPQAGGVYSATLKDDNVVLRRRSPHGYYISGIQNKEDITGEWNSAFREAADAVLEDRRTLLDYDRLYTVWQMVRNIRASDAPMVEIGVLRGGTSAFLARAAAMLEKKGRIFSCDTFSGHVETDGSVDGRHGVGTFIGRTSFEDVRDYLSAFEDVEVLQGDIKDTASRMKALGFSLLHLDVDVFETTRYVLDTFAGRMVAGGVIIVDDYAVRTCKGVKLAVDDFAARNPGFSFLHLLTGQAVMTRLPSSGT